MYDVVLLTLGAERDGHAGCGEAGGCCGESSAAAGAGCADVPRVPVLTCADALKLAGARVTTLTARSDREIDEALAALDGPARPDGLCWPAADPATRLVIATASDGQLRAVIRRMVRRYAPPPSRRPADLADNRTVPDLPPVGVLPLDPVRGGSAGGHPGSGGQVGSARQIGRAGQLGSGGQVGTAGPADLAGRLGLPRDPAAVAAAVLAGRSRRLDLLRNDAGSITLDGALLGGADDSGRPLAWRGRVEVDDAVLSAGDDPLLACVVGNAGGYARLDGIELLADPDPADGRVQVAVAVPVATRSLLRTRVRLEVRRARGRAVAVTPRDADLPYLDDGVSGELTRKRSWWVEPGCWAVFTG